MSGGSMNYLYQRIDEDSTFRLSTPNRRALKKHLARLATALKKVEWNDSGDSNDVEGENAAIEACLGQGYILHCEIEHALGVAEVLCEQISRANQVFEATEAR